MSQRILFTVFETPIRLDLSPLCQHLGLQEVALNSPRKAIKQLAKQAPDFILAEFIYGYSNNYAGINISNLDVMLHSLPKYAPNAKVIVIADKQEREYADKLGSLFTLHGILERPPDMAALEALLTICPPQ